MAYHGNTGSDSMSPTVVKRTSKKPVHSKFKLIPAVKPLDVVGLRNKLHLRQTELARLVSLSVRALSELERGGKPTDSVTRRVNEFKRLSSALCEVMKPAAIGPWLQTPNEAFDGLKPSEVIDRGEVDQLWSMVYFLRSGVAS